MRKKLDLDAAIALFSSLPACPQTVSVPLEQSCGRILAEDLCAPFPLPPFDKSPFDGFAMRSCDLPGMLRISAVLAAGEQNVQPLIPGTAARIFTGAPVPPGADVVCKQEDTTFSGEQVCVSVSPRAGTNIIRAGETFAPGQLLAKKGQALSPALFGVLASAGIAEVPVFRRPKAVILSTGSELSVPGAVRPAYGIYNSSYYVLRGYLERLGFIVAPPQIIPDEANAISSAVQRCMDSDADLVFTTGGASVGDYDFALQTAADIGSEILFWKIRMKPGGALVASRKNHKLLLGLSGNPAAAVMCLLVVLQPYLRALTGSNLRNQELTLPLLQDMPKTSSAARLLRGHMHIAGNRLFFAEHTGQRNADLQSFHAADLIAVIPGGTPPLHAGELVRVLRLPPDLC